MNDFILPGDMGAQIAQDIADAWDMLFKLCYIKQAPFEYAEAEVHLRLTRGLTELEAIRNVYHDIAYS